MHCDGAKYLSLTLRDSPVNHAGIMLVVQLVHFAMIEIVIVRLAVKTVVKVEMTEKVSVECTIHSTMM
jgi:hypothetical protein